MIGPTLAELITDVRAQLSEDDTEFFTADVVRRALNAAQRQIAADCPWAVLETFTTATVPGSPRYRLPGEVVQPTGVWMRLSSGQRYAVDYTEPDRIEGQKAFISLSTGIPRWATSRRSRTGVEIELFPSPNLVTTLEVEAFIHPAELVNNTDCAEFDPSLCPVLIAYALWKLKGKDEETVQADKYLAAYEAGLSDLRARRTRSQAIKANVARSRRSFYFWRYGVR